MLSELYIKNFAIIDDLALPFAAGFNVLTGETGAGKSIIIEALRLIMGDRASPDIIRSGADEAQVVAVFVKKCVGSSPAGDEEVIIKRTVSISGKSRAYVGGVPATMSELKDVSSRLLEIASQHEHQRLLDEASHLEFVDNFGGLKGLREKYLSGYERYASLAGRLKELELLSASKAEQKDFLGFQVGEIDSAKLKEGEDEELLRERNVVKYSARLLEDINFSDELLYSSDSSIASALSKVAGALGRISEIDATAMEWIKLSDSAQVALEELSRNIRIYKDKLDVDPSRLDEIDSRLYDISLLRKKYGGTITDILKKGKELAEKLSLIENCDAEISRVSKEHECAKGELQRLADQLSRERKKAAEKMSRAVCRELASLGMERATFAAGHERISIDEAGSTGTDKFCFMISPNEGEPVLPLARIASGGELSRVMLAIKRVLMDKAGLACTEVFDEVDSGIGGAVAEVVGMKLKEMSSVRQIICITHLPQVASFGDHHIAVSKGVTGGRTVTGFKALKGDGRVDEIARMLGGAKITAKTKEHAREMLLRTVPSFPRKRESSK